MTWVGLNDVVLLSECSHTPLPLVNNVSSLSFKSPRTKNYLSNPKVLLIFSEHTTWFYVMYQLVDICLYFSYLGKLKMFLLQSSYSAIYQRFELFKDRSYGHQRTTMYVHGNQNSAVRLLCFDQSKQTISNYKKDFAFLTFKK